MILRGRAGGNVPEARTGDRRFGKSRRRRSGRPSAEYARHVSRVLVLGGTRFVGPFVVQRLVERGHEVTLFHRGHHEPVHAMGAEHVHADFAQLPEHVPELAKREPDVVLDVSPAWGKAATAFSISRGLLSAASC